MTQTQPRTVEATTLAPADIVPHPMNPRQSAAPDEGLIASVAEMGVLERLVLAPVPDDLPAHARRLLVPEAKVLLIAGHRRLEAALEAELEAVPVDIRHDLDTTEKQLAAIAAENIHRTDLTALEEGDLYLALGDLGLTQAQISERTSVGKPRVSERTRVAKLPEPARNQLATNQITLDAALTLAKVADDPEQVERIAAQPVYLWDQEVRRILNAREHERENARRTKALADAGVPVLDDFPPAPGVDGDDTPAWWRLDDLLDVAYEGISRAAARHKDPSVSPSDNVDELDVDFDDIEAWHQATCTGHQVVKQSRATWQGETTDWIPICTTPAAHDALVDEQRKADGDSLAAPRPTPPPAAQVSKAEPTPEQLAEQKALAEAAKTRRAWLRNLLSDPNKASGALWKLIRCSAADGYDVSIADLSAGYRSEGAAAVTLDLLEGLNPPDVGSAPLSPAVVIAAWADHAPEASPLSRLGLAAVFGSHGAQEDYLATTRHEWKGGQYGYCVGWIRVLDVLGYPWTAQELEWLDRVKPARADDNDEGEVEVA